MNELQAWRVAPWVLLAGTCACGCSSVPRPPETAAAPAPASAVKLTYRTTGDRLNVAAGTQLVSYQQPIRPLPDFSTTTLIITSPHPSGAPGLALATVVVRPVSAEGTVAPSVWKWVGGAAYETPATQPSEVWVMDIPQWQVDAVLGKLQAANFFQRSKILNADVFLAAEVGAKKQGKECKSLPELDALILRSRHEGRLVAGGGPTQLATSRVAGQTEFVSSPPSQPFAPPPFAPPGMPGFSPPQPLPTWPR